MPKRQMTGLVVSNAMQKTVRVQVERVLEHPLVKKMVRYRKVFFAHDEKELAKVGDSVLIEECRPLSKNKHFTLLEIIKKSETFTDDKTGKTFYKDDKPYK